VKIILCCLKTTIANLCIAALFTACNPFFFSKIAFPKPSKTTGSYQIIPENTVYISIPQDENIDIACRITINFYFSYKQGFRLEEYRALFVPSSQYLAESRTPPSEALILLDLLPASQWWQETFPLTPIPGTLLPEEDNEYFYYAEYTGHYDSNTTPFYSFPDHMIFTMIAEGSDSCKIKNYGKG
jgi:hypothetical protein